MRDFRGLEVWKKSIDLVEKVYFVTKKFPEGEKFGLISQIRRASVSVSSNIAEGCGRRTSRDFVGFLYNSFGSLKEVECQLIIANRLGYLGGDVFKGIMRDIDDVGKMLHGFIKYVREKDVR